MWLVSLLVDNWDYYKIVLVILKTNFGWLVFISFLLTAH